MVLDLPEMERNLKRSSLSGLGKSPVGRFDIVRVVSYFLVYPDGLNLNHAQNPIISNKTLCPQQRRGWMKEEAEGGERATEAVSVRTFFGCVCCWSSSRLFYSSILNTLCFSRYKDLEIFILGSFSFGLLYSTACWSYERIYLTPVSLTFFLSGCLGIRLYALSPC